LYSFENIHQLQIEPTTYCNSFCPSCARNLRGGKLNPSLKLNHIVYEDWCNIMSNHNLKHIKSIYFNGNFGDCCMHPEFLNMIEHLLKIKPTLDVKVMTNGGMQSNNFWRQLSQLLQKFSHHMIAFALDGLDDTLSIYRRNINYDTVIEHAKCFIDEGGIAEWRMIIFDHNKHQIQSAKEISRKLGFARFYLHNSYQPTIEAVQYKNFPQRIITAPDKIDAVEYQIKYNETFKQITTPDYDQNIKVSCPWMEERWLQLDSNGLVWPCCFTSEEKLYNKEWNYYYLQTKFGKNFNNINKITLDKILENDFYRQYVPSMWTSSKTCLECNNSDYNFQ